MRYKVTTDNRQASAGCYTVLVDFVLTVDIWRRSSRNTCSKVTDSCLLKPSLFFTSCFRLYKIRTWAAARQAKHDLNYTNK